MISKENVKHVFFINPIDLRRDCSKHRHHGTLVSLRNSVELERDHMEMFLRYFTSFYSTLLSPKSSIEGL